jgi:hypothetical protein
MHRAVEGHDRLAGASGAANPRRPGEVTLHRLPLLGVQENGPLLPRKIEGTLEFLDVGHHAESALGIGMIEGIRNGR